MYIHQMLITLMPGDNLEDIIDEWVMVASLGQELGKEALITLGQEMANIAQGELLKRHSYVEGKDVGQMQKSGKAR